MKKKYNKRRLVRYTITYNKNGKVYTLTFNAYGGKEMRKVLRGWGVSEDMIIHTRKDVPTGRKKI